MTTFLWILAGWIALGYLITTALEPFWSNLETLLTAPFWPVVLWMKISDRY